MRHQARDDESLPGFAVQENMTKPKKPKNEIPSPSPEEMASSLQKFLSEPSTPESLAEMREKLRQTNPRG
jgi:hypothetical protein